MTNELTKIEKELSPVVKQATGLEIVDDITLKEGVELLSILNKWNDNITEEKERVTKPLNEALKAERSRWKPLETLYTTAIEELRAKMTTYQTNLIKAQKIAQQKLADKVASGYMKPETAVAKMSEIKDVEKEHATDAGLVQFREKAQLKITDVNAIPRAYLIPDEALILKDLKNGEVVKGCEIEIIQIPINFR